MLKDYADDLQGVAITLRQYNTLVRESQQLSHMPNYGWMENLIRPTYHKAKKEGKTKFSEVKSTVLKKSEQQKSSFSRENSNSSSRDNK